MKLVEILARELEEWPEAVQTYAQDDDGTVGASDGHQVRDYSGKGWSSGENEWVTEAALNGEKLKLASDAKTAIITRADWEAERARIKGETKVKHKANKDGWIRHRGGKCPVDAGTLVDVKFRDGCISYGQPALIDGDPDSGWAKDWSHTDHPGDIMAWKLHNPEQATTEQSSDVEMPAAKYFDGPLQWRDRIHTIDFDKAAAQKTHEAAMAALDSERAELVAKLKAEGLALVQEEEDMSDWRNWKEGDKVELLTSFGRTAAKGQIMVVSKIEGINSEQPVRVTPENDHSDGWWPNPNQMKWHSRPSN